MIRCDYETLETKYQEQIRENLRLTREVIRKEIDINSWVKKYDTLENIYNDEKKKAQEEREEWECMKKDLLLVVRAADDYRTETMKGVEEVKQENVQLLGQIADLQEQLKQLKESCTCSQRGTLESKRYGSKRNALLQWVKQRTKGYDYVEITNFSTSWSDGMALCALLHSYVPDRIPYADLKPENSHENFKIAFQVAEMLSVPTTITIEEMTADERPSWEKVMSYIKEIYNKLEVCDAS